MKGIDDHEDGLNDDAWKRAWDSAMREDAARRAAQLPAKRKQRIPVVPTGGKP